MSLREEQCKKVCRILDNVLANRPTERDSLIVAVKKAFAEPKTFTVIDTKTGREADTYNIALKEEWAKGLCYCDIDMFVIGEDGTLMLIDDCGKCAYCPPERFEVKWHE